jgi:hypothetical protein
MAQIPGTPEIVPAGLLELWTAITPDCRVGSRWGLNRSCSPCQDLSNAMLHTRIGCRKEVASWFLVVGSQTANLTPGPSFAHNLGCRCPNCQCEGIFDIYVSRVFQWHQEHPNARSLRGSQVEKGPFCRALNIRESRRTPTPNFSKCWASHPHLAKVGLRQLVHSWSTFGARTRHKQLDSQDSPQPRLGGSHHLPPYSILCASPWGPHPNGILSQVGVSKFPQLGLSRL